MNSFEYEPINLEGHSFRLLRLCKGDFGNVRCEIIHAYVDDESLMEYEALSYTWGGTYKAHDIEVGGSIMAVTQNLSLALKSLRKTREDRILWVDAICIDQNNDKERGHQVRQMTSIYAKAARVLIWLGPATPETDLVFDAMSQFEDEASKHACRDWKASDERWQGIASSVHLSDDDGKMMLLPNEIEGLEDLLTRSWFDRVWIIQEVANARAARVTCGTKSVLARTFALFPYLSRIMPSEHCQAILDIMPGPTRNHSWWTESHDLSTLLLKFRGSHASDPRDKIYALLGISSDRDSESFPVPDYEKTDNEVAQYVIGFLLQVHTGTGEPSCLRTWTLAKLMQHPGHVADEACVEAAGSGSIVTVKGLLDTGKANPNYKTLNGQTPLLRAIEEGHEVIVKHLIGMEVCQVDHKYKDSPTPLLLAVKNGRHSVVRLLVESGKVDVNFKGPFDWNPLLHAVRNSHYEMVKFLIGRGKANVDVADQYSQTPLLYAVSNGDDEMARLLIQRGKANINAKNQHGQNPLLAAARAGREVALKYMLETGAADFDVIDDSGWDPLCTAAIRGHEAVVHMLLQTNDANASTSAHQTAPAPKRSLALELLEVHKTGCNLKGDRAWPLPLSWALQRGRLDLFELFLKGDLGLSSLSLIKDGKIAYEMIKTAAQFGLESVVKRLLSKVKTRLTHENYWATEALRWAVTEGDSAIVTLIVNSGRINVCFGHLRYRWFEVAAQRGHEAVVEQLLLSGWNHRVDRENALLAAATHGFSMICRRLLEYGGIDVNRTLNGNKGITSLRIAAANGHAAVVKLLLGTPGIDVEAKDGVLGHSPLSIAAVQGRANVVKLLLENSNVDRNTLLRLFDFAEAERRGGTWKDVCEVLRCYGISD